MILGENIGICASKESNFEDSHTNIQDTDFATSTTTRTKSEILTQSATVLLAQAPTISQNAMSLLR